MMKHLLTFLLAITCSGATTVSIVGDEFYINGKPTYQGRSWRGHKIQG